jgi:anaerobic selenocysteine-containing dehydrogenase
MQYAWGGNVGMQMIKEVADNVAGHRGVIINAGAAARLGIADGDAIEIATPQRSVRGRAVVRQGIRPDTLLLIGQFDHWATPLAKDFGAAWQAAVVKAGGQPQDYPFWLLTARSMQYAWGGNVGVQMIKEVADNVAGHRGVIMNTEAARKLGIAEGDEIEIATPARSVRGSAVLRQGIRPDTLLLIGQFEHWATPLAKDFGVPSLNTLATMSMDLTDSTGSGADIVRVNISRGSKP